MADKLDKPKETKKDQESNTMDTDVKLLMRIIQVNQTLAVQNWEVIARQEGLSIAAAKQKFGALKKEFLKTANDDHPAPVILRRKRAVPADQEEQEKEPDDEVDTQDKKNEEPVRPMKKQKNANGRTPLPTLADKRRNEAARAEAARAQAARPRTIEDRMRDARREWGFPVSDDEEQDN